MSRYIINPDLSPLDVIDTSFRRYVETRECEKNVHMKGSVPDYAFALDYELRSKMDKIPYFYSACKKISATIATRQQQITNQQGLRVSSTQYPEIYQMGLDCAHRLGIAVPNIYIMQGTQVNAETISTDEISPIIILYTGVIDRMTPGELKCVIAHECGHIHNQHGVYKLAIRTLLNSGKGVAGVALQLADIALAQFWIRAMEITADRAALICADDPEDARNVDYKFLSGATINTSYTQEADLKALRQQLDMTLDNPTRFIEVLSDHPSSLRRIFADLEFEECEVYYSWRPEMKKPGAVSRTKAETDARVQKLVNIMNNK